MALYSPGVETREISTGAGVAEAGSSPGAAIIDATWGPVEQRTLVTSQTELVENFGEPTDDNAKRWFTAANFLDYAGSLYVVNVAASDALNADDTGTGVLIKNSEEYDGVTVSGQQFIARYPGTMGNSLKVEVCDDVTTFSGWAYADNFDTAPGTSENAANFGASADELHVVVIDEDGLVTGSPGTILETFEYLSKASDGKTANGGNNYYVDVLKENSQYIYAGTAELSAADGGETAYGGSVTDAQPFATGAAIITASLTGGTLGTGAGTAEMTSALSLFSSTEDVDISFILTADGGETVGTDNAASFANAAIAIAESRQDCVVFVSPMTLNSTGVPAEDPGTQVTTFTAALTRSSYAFVDSGYKYQYDRYNDKFRWVPLNGDIAGLTSRLDRDYEPWFSPAGFSRGNVLNVTKLSWNPNQTERDVLYKNSVNPVVNFPGRGTVLFGDKTFVSKPGAFDRINVRRLFIVMKKSVKDFAQSVLFEQNDAFTRSLFTSSVEQFLDNVQARRGIDEYRVVADESNNTATVLNNKQFVGDIFVRPINSINFIRLNFVAVRAGVDFSEIAG